MLEVRLEIGRSQQVIGGIEPEILSWYDPQSTAYPLPETGMQQMRLQLKAERQRAKQLAQYLRSQGIDPDNLPETRLRGCFSGMAFSS